MPPDDRLKQLKHQDQAIAQHETSLQVYTKAAHPLRWAATQVNLGNAYYERRRGERKANLERAIAHYEAAALVYTCDTFPEQWDMIQHNLAAIYSKRVSEDYSTSD